MRDCRGRELLLKLARRGCSIRCVITPPSQDNLLPDRVACASERVRALIALLESGDPALQNIEFVISPFLQKNFYIIGRLCFSEGFRIGLGSGTLRQSHPKAITSSRLLHRALFEWLRDYTLTESPPEHSQSSSHGNLRLTVLRCLKESPKFCEERCESMQDREPICDILSTSQHTLRTGSSQSPCRWCL
jgi:hypothetical protein